MVSLSSPSRRQSPRLEKHGIRATPPAKTSRKEGRSQDVVGGACLDQRTRTTPTKQTNRIKTPDSGRVISFCSATTPTRLGKVCSQLEISMEKMSPDKKAAAGGPRSTQQTRRVVAISPRTRGSAIVSILASPDEFAANNTGAKNIFVSPSDRSSAEATLHYLARATKANKRSLDTGSAAVRRKRSRRKAASVANDKVRSICQMNGFDDLDDLIQIDENPSKKSNIGKKKAVSDLVLSGKIQSASSSSKGNEPRVTVETFFPKGKLEERWFRNFKKWTSSQQYGLVTESDPTPSPLPKRWVQDQRAHYRSLKQHKKTQMTQDRITLLESAGFCWELQNRKIASKTDSKHIESNDSGKKTPTESDTVREKGEHKSGIQVQSKCESSIESLSKRKSTRKSVPTQFYHNIETSSLDKEKDSAISNRESSISKLYYNIETSSLDKGKDSAISNRESSLSKLYYNIETSSLDKEKDSATSNRESSLSKESKKRSQTMLGPISLAHASTTTAKNGKQFSPSKRRSVSTPNDSLASLSVDASTKKKSDKQNQGKKKKRRGRHSTSSLSALAAQMKTSSKEGKSGDTKDSGSFSHKELQRQLSKSKKKPARMILKTPSEHADGNAGEHASSTAKRSTSTLSNFEHESSDGKTGMKGAKYKNEAPDSPSRATKLLTLLSVGDASKTNHVQPTFLGSDLIEKSNADMSEVCVTKLLLSCLSEDSAEKESQLLHAGFVPVANEGAASLLTEDFSENNRDSHGTPFSSNLKTPEESFALEPSGDGIDTYNTQAESLSSSSNEQGTEILPTQTAYASKERESNPPVEDQGQPVSKSKRQRFKSSFVKRGCLVEQHTLPQREHVYTDRRPVFNNQQISSWTCDICQEVMFGNHDDAIAHERECAGRNNTKGETSISNEDENRKDAGTLKKRENNSPAKEQEKLTSKSIRHESKSLSFTECSFAEQPTSTHQDSNNGRISSWTCDICQVATFGNYADAIAHEKECAGTNNTQAKVSISNKGKEEAEASKKRMNDPPVEEQGNLTSKSIRHDSKSLSLTKGNFVEQHTLPQNYSNSERISSWTCDRCQEALFGNYDDAIAHERECARTNTTQAEVSITNKEEEEAVASKKRMLDPSVEEPEKFPSKSIRHEPKILPRNDSQNERTNIWTGDVCQKAMFEDYDNAMAHKRECVGKQITQSKLPILNKGKEKEAKASKKRIIDQLNEEPEKPTSRRKHHKSEISSFTKGNFTQQPQTGGDAGSVPRSFSTRNEEPLIYPACGVDENTQTKLSSSTPNKQNIPTVGVANGQTSSTVGKKDSSQLTPLQYGPIDEFSPLSLMSPLLANKLLELMQHGPAKPTGNLSFPPSQLNADSPVQPVKPASAIRRETSTELANPSCLSLVPHRHNLNDAFAARARVNEPQLQMTIAEKQCQEKMAEFGRLELEARMVTKRMREIEGEINCLDSNRTSNGINNYNRIEGSESISRKSSYHSESTSLSLQRSHSLSNHSESSDEGEYSDEYYSQSKRRQKRHTSSDQIEKIIRRAEEDTYERSAKRVKVRSRSSRQEERGKMSCSSYNNSEIHVESSSSKRSKKLDRHRTECFSAPERQGRYDHPPGAKKRSKGRDSRTAAFTKKRPRASGSKKSQSKQKQNKFPQPESNLGEVSYSCKPTAARPTEGSPEKKESCPRSRKPPSKSRDRWREQSSDSKSPTEERSVPPIIVPIINDGAAEANEKISNSSSTKLPAGVNEGKSVTNEKESTAILNTKNTDDNVTRNPLYWLAGGENSSDEESWDFDGPMILPPPPL